MWYFLYNLVLTVAFALVLPFMPFIFLLGPRYRDGYTQRLGFYPKDIFSSLAGDRPVWIHAASVGEVRSAHPDVTRDPLDAERGGDRRPARTSGGLPRQVVVNPARLSAAAFSGPYAPPQEAAAVLVIQEDVYGCKTVVGARCKQ